VKTITYKISRYPTTKRLTNSDVDNEIKKALDVWAGTGVIKLTWACILSF
jgi:hypothetical protein